MSLKTFVLDDKEYSHTDSAEFVVELGKGRGSYNQRKYRGNDVKQAFWTYRCYNVGLGYKKRLVMFDNGKKLVLHKTLT